MGTSLHIDGDISIPRGEAFDLDLADHVERDADYEEDEHNVDLDGHREVVGVRIAEEVAEETPEEEVGEGRLPVVWEHQTIKGCKIKKK